MSTKILYGALLAVQGELPAIQRNKINPAFRSKYVSLEKLHEEVIPLINRHGLVWITEPNLDVDASQPILTYRLVHAESGEQLTGSMALMLAKNDPQGQGSAITYARRYALMAVLGLVADEDDDGNQASRAASRPAAKQRPTSGGASPLQLADLRTGYEELGWTTKDLQMHLTAVGVQDVSDVRAAMRSLTAAQVMALQKDMSDAIEARLEA